MAPPPPTGDVESQKYSFNDEGYGISEERVRPEGHPLHGVDPSSRLPIEYRTLSIHVDTETGVLERQQALPLVGLNDLYNIIAK